MRFTFVTLVPGVVVVHSRYLTNVSCIKSIQSRCNLSKPCQCPQLHIISLCPRGCWEDQCDSITEPWEGKAASEYEVLSLVAYYCLLRDPGALLGAGQENRKVVIRMPKWKKVLLANAKDIGKKPIIYIGLASERLCDHCNNSFSAYEPLIYKNIDSTSLDKID